MKASVEHCRGFLIDWDGTLINSLPIKIANCAQLFSDRFGVDADSVSGSYARHSGVPRRILFDRIATDCLGRNLVEMEFNEMSEAFSRTNRHRIEAGAQLRQHSIEALEAFRRTDRVVYVSTSADPEEVEPLATAFGVATICNGILGSRPGFSKGPEHAAFVMRTHNLDATDLAGVGDDVNDMELFRLAQVLPIGITGTRDREVLVSAGAAWIVDSLMEVAERVS